MTEFCHNLLFSEDAHLCAAPSLLVKHKITISTPGWDMSPLECSTARPPLRDEAESHRMQWRIQKFSQTGSANPELGLPTYYFCNFFPENEIEKNWTEKGACVHNALPLRSANRMKLSFKTKLFIYTSSLHTFANVMNQIISPLFVSYCPSMDK